MANSSNRNDDEGLSRELGGRLDVAVRAAIARSKNSNEVAAALLKSGFYSAAFVWSVRSIEIFLKEVCLLPIYFEQTGDFEWSWKKVRNTFGSSNWRKSMKIIEDTYGPFDEMITKEGENVWEVWNRVFVPKRGEIVHGRAEAQEELATLGVRWAELFRSQFTLRLIAANRHPVSTLFLRLLESLNGAAES